MGVRGLQRLRSRVFGLRTQGRLREALEVAVLAAPDSSEMTAKTAYWMACLHSRPDKSRSGLPADSPPPQSSQVSGQGEFCWDDQDLAESEIARAYAQLAETRQFDADQVILVCEKDQCLGEAEALRAEMASRGFPGELLVKPGLGHDFPRDFPGILASAIDHLLV